MSITKDQVKTALSNVLDPESKQDLISQQKVGDIITQEKFVSFSLLNVPPHRHEDLRTACEKTIRNMIDDEAVVDIQFETARESARTAEAGTSNGKSQTGGAQQAAQEPQSPEEMLPGVKNIIAVASGKGGVGKSTVAVNLAAGLARSGASVGLLDTDIYGPSIPTMFDVQEQPSITTDKKIVPIEKYGVKLLSMGFLVDMDQAMIWRGPMVTSAVKQFMTDAVWGDLDFMILDLPPGTGDIQLTIVQTVPLTGAIVVSTPQNVALADARKGVAMFNKVNVPVLGIIENMAYFTPPELPDKKYYIFGKHGARNLAEKMDTHFLGEIPIQEEIRETSDTGKPIVLEDSSSPVAQSFIELTNNVIQQIAVRNENMPPTEKIEIKYGPGSR